MAAAAISTRWLMLAVDSKAQDDDLQKSLADVGIQACSDGTRHHALTGIQARLACQILANRCMS